MEKLLRTNLSVKRIYILVNVIFTIIMIFTLLWICIFSFRENKLPGNLDARICSYMDRK